MTTAPNTPWVDGPDGGTPVSAGRLNRLEARVSEALTAADAALAATSTDVFLTEAEFDALEVKDPAVTYWITP